MIRRIRIRAPLYCSIALIIGAVSLAVSASGTAPEPELSWAEISLALWVRMGAAVGTSIGATWALLVYFQGREDKRRNEFRSDIKEAMALLSNSFHTHKGDVYAHPAAMKNGHADIEDDIRGIKDMVDRILRDVEKPAGESRDPDDTPPHKRHRANDSHDDYTRLRGKQ